MLIKNKLWSYKENEERDILKRIEVRDDIDIEDIIKIVNLLLNKFLPKDVNKNIKLNEKSYYGYKLYKNEYYDVLNDNFVLEIPNDLYQFEKSIFQTIYDIPPFGKFLLNYTKGSNLFIESLIIITLHEIGHYYQFEYNRNGNGYRLIKDMILKECNNDNISDYLYRLSPSESFADLYVYNNFKAAHEYLKSKKYINSEFVIPNIEEKININRLVDVVNNLYKEEIFLKNDDNNPPNGIIFDYEKSKKAIPSKLTKKYLNIFDKEYVDSIRDILYIMSALSSVYVSQNIDMGWINSLIDSVNKTMTYSIYKNLYNMSLAIVNLPEVLDAYQKEDNYELY